MTLADQIVVLRGGRVEQCGSPREIYENPANEFVAGFIGSPRMNFLKAVAQGSGHFTIADKRFPETGLSTSMASGWEFRLGIRPEHILIATQGDQTIPAKV